MNTNVIRQQWDRFQKLPLGRVVFGKLLGRVVPYTGTIKPQVLELRQGFAKVRMRDRRVVRNHLDSVHAIALINLGEVVTGLAVNYSLPEGARAIVTSIKMDYVKKARGDITATCEVKFPEKFEKIPLTVESVLRDRSDEVVARAQVVWLLDPPKNK